MVKEKCGNDLPRYPPQQGSLEAEVPKKRELLALAEAVLRSTKDPRYCFRSPMVRTVPKRTV